MKVTEMLKAVADAKEDAAKKGGLQALADDVRIGEDEYQYEDLIKGSSQKTIFGIHQDYKTNG